MRCTLPCKLADYCGETACPEPFDKCIIYLEGKDHPKLYRLYQNRRLRRLGYDLSERSLKDLAEKLKSKP